MNKSVKIYLNKISDIKEFAGIVTSFAPNVDIIKGSVVYDAKSIMGVILLGGTDPVEVKIHADDKNTDAGKQPDEALNELQDVY